MFARSLLGLCGVVGSALVVVLVFGGEPAEVAKAPAPDELEALLKERHDTLRKLVEYYEYSYREGKRDYEDVLHAKSQLLEAELDMVGSKAERIRVREEQVNNLRNLEEIVEAKLQAMAESPDKLLLAKARRLKAEIELEREKRDR